MSRNRAIHRALRLACLCAFLGIAGANAAEPHGDDVTLNFVNADIDAVIRAMSKITHRNFIVDPRVKGTLNIVTNTPVSPDLAYQMLLSALRLQGYALVENGEVTQVVPEADAKLHSMPVTTGKAPLRGDRLATQIFAIKNESAAQLVQVIRPLVSPNNTVTAYAANNTLVVTDYAENLKRIARIIEAIDVPQSDVVVLPVQYASATDVAAMVNRLLTGGPGAADASQHMTVIADDRINALLVQSDNPSRINSVRQLLKSVDQPSLTGNVHVIYLKNAEATALAQTLRGVLSGEITEAAASSSTSLNSGGSAATSTGGTGMNTAAGSSQRNAAPSFSNKSASAGTNSGGGIVQADPLTNSLIITAPDAVYNNIRRVVDMLDHRRAQIYVEALIAEISADRLGEFGMQWQGSTPSGNNNKVFGGTNFTSGNPSTAGGSNIVGLMTNPLSAAQGLNLAFGGGSLTVNGVTILNINGLVRALESQGNTNILSTPNMIMLDNEEAKIVVGQNVPIVTGSYATTTTGTNTANPFQTYSREDVGLTLKIKPQITEGGVIRLQIYEESSAVVASTATAATGPTTTKRSLETTALIDDGSIIALGGLVQDNYVSGEGKVPLLGDIPVLGNLFKYESRQRTKTNLVMFLRPKILRTAEDYRNLTADRYDYVIGQQKNLDSPDRLMRHEDPAPQLPPLNAAPAAPATSPTPPAPAGEVAPASAAPVK
jgi:general secretion pathway protein D